MECVRLGVWRDVEMGELEERIGRKAYLEAVQTYLLDGFTALGFSECEWLDSSVFLLFPIHKIPSLASILPNLAIYFFTTSTFTLHL